MGGNAPFAYDLKRNFEGGSLTWDFLVVTLSDQAFRSHQLSSVFVASRRSEDRLRTAGLTVVAGVVLAPGVIVGTPGTASAAIPVTLTTTWPCAPLAVYVDPAAPEEVRAALSQWHKAFRPDWTFTTDPGAPVQVWMRKPANPDDGGLTTIWGTSTTRTKAIVEIDPHGGDLGNIARHELGHVAGLEHNLDTQFSAMNPYPLMHRYGVSDLVGMRVAARICHKRPV
ncbi:MAG: Matrixin [Actinomycetia bacterium]|nr:Matrixin [Actinomycetes bacterium]